MILRSYKCNFCGAKKDFFVGDFLPDKRNIIADNCKCGWGSMIIDLEDPNNQPEEFIEAHYNILLKTLTEAGIGV